MEIGIGIWAFVVYILFVMFWYLVVKRTIAEAMFLGVLIACGFNGIDQIPTTFITSLQKAVTENVMAAIILFTVMASIMTKTGIINHLVNILNSLLGKVRGGPAYVSTCASGMFGMVASASSANSATVGSITVPWMLESGWPRHVAATINTGNSDLGICGPAASSLFLMLSFAPIAQSVTYGELYVPLMCGAAWTLAYRLLVVRYYVWKYKIPAMEGHTEKLSVVFKQGGTSFLMFLGIIIPLVLTIGPVSKILAAQPSFGEKAVSAINIIIWVPVLIMFICLILGRKLLPKTVDGWKTLLAGTAKTCCSCGAVSLFALTGSSALTMIGFGDGLSVILSSLDLPKAAIILLVGFVVALVAGPLNATATTVSLGLVAYTAMVSVGVPPTTAVVAFLIFVSTEGASPPMSSPIFISSSIAGVENVSVMFKPLILNYLIPLVLVGALVAMGILPIVGG